MRQGGTHLLYATNNEISQMIENVRNGAIFSTDRIALDPFFSKNLAGTRYSYWLEDLVTSSKTKVIISECNGENIGFSVYVDKGRNCYTSPLGGLFPQYLDSGLGVVSTECTMKYLHDIKAKIITTHVSSNNLQMLKLHMLFGATITNLQYVLIKHS